MKKRKSKSLYQKIKRNIKELVGVSFITFSIYNYAYMLGMISNKQYILNQEAIIFIYFLGCLLIFGYMILFDNKVKCF